jgi:hypothetical protein
MGNPQLGEPEHHSGLLPHDAPHFQLGQCRQHRARLLPNLARPMTRVR